MSRKKKILMYLMLIVASFIVFSPILYAVSVSFMTPKELFEGRIFPSTFNFDNYIKAANSFPLIHYLIVSFIMSSLTMLGVLVVSSLTAYSLVFIPFKGANIIFLIILSTMLIPWESTIIPNYLTILNLGWIDTYKGLILPFLAFPFGVFLLRQHFLTIPKEMWESASIDGCTRFKFLISFVLPLSKSTLSSLGLYSFLITWNKYLWPLLVTNNEKVRPVQIGLKMLLVEEGSTEWNVVLAAVVVILLPTLLLIFIGLKYVSKALTAGAVKG